MTAVNLPAGARMWVTDLIQYDVQYFNGRFTYRQHFAVIHFDRAVVDRVGGVVNALLQPVQKALYAVPELGPLLGWGFKLLVDFVEGFIKNRDGSISLMMAYNAFGTPNGTVDLTATPLPGVSATDWRRFVDGMLRAAHASRGPRRNAFGAMADAEGGLDLDPPPLALTPGPCAAPEGAPAKVG